MENQKQYLLILCNEESNLNLHLIQQETGFEYSGNDTTEEQIIFKLGKTNNIYSNKNPIYLSINLVKMDKWMFRIGNYIELYEITKSKGNDVINHYARCEVDSFDFLKSLIKSCLSKFLKKEE